VENNRKSKKDAHKEFFILTPPVLKNVNVATETRLSDKKNVSSFWRKEDFFLKNYRVLKDSFVKKNG